MILFALITAVCSYYVAPSPHNTHVVEDKVMSITNMDTLKKFSVFENVKQHDSSILLRSSKGEGSVIKLNEEIESDNWSFEMIVNHLNLRDIEKAGIYLWYTDKKLESGSYRGANPTFNGFMIGIEFTQDKADIAFSFNYGMDYKGKETETVRYDHINPLLIEHLDHFKVKFIHTEKNFKVEIYDEKDNLLSDNFRIHEPLIMNKGKHKKNFAITTFYQNVPVHMAFDLHLINLSTRHESEEYDARDLHTGHNSFPRTKSDEEIRTAIAEIDHFANYLNIVLGFDLKSSNIIQMVIEIKKKTRLLKESIEGLISAAEEMTRNNSKDIDTEKLKKTAEINRNLEEVISKVSKYKSMMKEAERSKSVPTINLNALLLFFGVAFIVIRSLKFLSNIQISKSKNRKQE